MQPTLVRRGFTLIELLLVIGIIAILAGIIILAINPSSQLLKAEDAKRVAQVRELKSAILQYQIEHGNVPNGITATTMPICRYGTTDPSCINLDVLVDEDYVTTLDIDASESNVLTTGYTVNQDPGGFTTVGATYLGVSGGGSEGSGGGGGGGTTVIATADLLSYMSTSSSGILPVVDPGLTAIDGTNLTQSIASLVTSTIPDSAAVNAVVAGDYTITNTIPAAITITSNRAVPIAVSATGATTCTTNAPYTSTTCDVAGFTFNTDTITDTEDSISISTPETGNSNSLSTEKWRLNQVSNIQSDSVHDSVLNMMVVNNTLFFSQGSAAEEKYLFKTDGTTLTRLYRIGNLTTWTVLEFNNEVYFTAQIGTSSVRSLFKTNGTTVTRLTNLGSYEGINVLGVYNNRLYFDSQLTASAARQLFSTDGTTVIQHTNYASGAGNGISMFEYNNAVYYCGLMPSGVGISLFQLDGTSLIRLTNMSMVDCDYMNTIDNKALLRIHSGGVQKLYTFNGTSIVQISNTNPGGTDFPSGVIITEEFNNEIYYNGHGSGSFRKIFKTDGATVTQVSNVVPAGHDIPAWLPINSPGFKLFNNELYFWLSNGSTAYHLFKTNGTSLTKVDNASTISARAFSPIVYDDKIMWWDAGYTSTYIVKANETFKRHTSMRAATLRDPVLFNGKYYFYSFNTIGKLYTIEEL